MFLVNHLGPVVKGDGRNIIHNMRSLAWRFEGSLETPLFDPTPGIRDVYYWHSISKGSCFYGIERAFQEYAGITGRLYGAIEHGLYLGDYVNKYESNQSGLPLLLTFGDSRYEHIYPHANVHVEMCGPYIHYASPFYDEFEFAKTKEKLGNTLLVFLMHSTEMSGVYFDVESLVVKVENIARERGMDTILFCVYFNDINLGLGDRLNGLGYRVVCAGHRSDPQFLSRLRTLIELSDLTASNGVGTHVGYCEYLGKEHLYIQGDVEADDDPELGENALLSPGDGYAYEVREIVSALSCGDADLKYRVLNRYWGFDKTKSPDEIAGLFSKSKRAYEVMKTGCSGSEAWQAV